MLKQVDNLIEEVKEEEYSNPLAPSSYPQYGTELDVKYCSFYVKTGACRFGERCSRYHMKPPSSDTILLPAMFNHISLGQDFTNDLDIDSGLEHEETDTNKSFAEFFWDVLPEFQSMGEVSMFKVCCNHEPHLRGNVYVQFKHEGDAVKAYAKFNGRFYASRQISCEFIKIEKWKSAICGQFHRQKCPKGKHCNFLHVFKNPGGLFMVPGSEVPENGGTVHVPSRGSTNMGGGGSGPPNMQNMDAWPGVQAVRAKLQTHHHGQQASFPADAAGRSWRPRRGFYTSPVRGGRSPRRGGSGSPIRPQGRPDQRTSPAWRGGSSPHAHRGGSSPHRGPSPYRGASPHRNASPYRSGASPHRGGNGGGGGGRWSDNHHNGSYNSRNNGGGRRQHRSPRHHSRGSTGRARSRSPRRR